MELILRKSSKFLILIDRENEFDLNEKLNDCLAKLLDAKVQKHESEKEVKMRSTLESMKRIFPKVYGRVIDLVNLSSKKYDTAISIILGKNADAIVVENEKTAVECVQYLKESKLGIMTFLPLDSLKTKAVSDKHRSIKGARPAVDVLQYLLF